MARIGAKLCQNAFRTILHVSSFDAEKLFSAKFSDHNFRFSLIWRGFGRSTAERTSKSASTSNFALDRLILRSARRKNPEFGSNLGSPKIFTRLKVSVSLEELFPQPHIRRRRHRYRRRRRCRRRRRHQRRHQRRRRRRRDVRHRR